MSESDDAVGIRGNCIICFSSLTGVGQVSALPCGHTFHFICVTQWIESKQLCPICRRKATRRNIVEKLYFDNSTASEGVSTPEVNFAEKAENLALELQQEKDFYKKSEAKRAELQVENSKLNMKLEKERKRVERELPAIQNRNRQLEMMLDDQHELQRKLEYTEGCLKACKFYALLSTTNPEKVEAELSKYVSANGDVDAGKFTVLLRRQIDDLKARAKATNSDIHHYEQKIRQFGREAEEKDKMIMELRREVQSLQKAADVDTPINKRLRAVLSEATPRRPSLGFDRTQPTDEGFDSFQMNKYDKPCCSTDNWEIDEFDRVFQKKKLGKLDSENSLPKLNEGFGAAALNVTVGGEESDFSFDIPIPKTVMGRVHSSQNVNQTTSSRMGNIGVSNKEPDYSSDIRRREISRVAMKPKKETGKKAVDVGMKRSKPTAQISSFFKRSNAQNGGNDTIIID